MLDSKKFNSNFLSEQILDENSDESTEWLMIAFDLGSTDDPQSWLEKLYLVHAMYAVEREYLCWEALVWVFNCSYSQT